jgi:hypothetical protein
MSSIKLILAASIEVAAYLVISAERMSIKIIGRLLSVNGLSKLLLNLLLFLSNRTTLSGFKSHHAAPSFRNSGFGAASNSIYISFI